MAKRPNILALATKIGLECMTYLGITYDDPEYKILDPIIDDDMCEVFMHLKLEKLRDVDDVAKRTGKDKAFVQEQLDKLVNTGAVRTRYRDGKKYYTYPIWVPGIMEGILSNKEQNEAHPELGACFEEYTRRRLAVLVPSCKPGMAFMRIIPVESAIKTNQKKASYDEVSQIIENAWAISVGPCSCRRAQRLNGMACGHIEDDMCMYVNDNAVCYTESGAHRAITKEEAYEILKRAEDNGLMHELNQFNGFTDTTAICNCCVCSCFSLRIASYFKAPNMLKTNYVAKVSEDRCTACGQCVENCQVNAVRLGSKLCGGDKYVPEYDYDIPEDTLWLGGHHDPDFRENRKESLSEGTAPCKAASPANVPVQGVVKLAYQGRYKTAIEMVKKYNPFPAITTRVGEKTAENACTRKAIDEAVAINDIIKYLADYDMASKDRFVPKMLNQYGVPFTNKVAVIGAGPAGLSCAYYLKNKGYPVTVFEKEKELGGLMRYAIPSFLLEKDIIDKEIDLLKQLGIEFVTGVEYGKDITKASLIADGYEAIFMGIGAQVQMMPTEQWAKAEGVLGSLEFMRKMNMAEDKPEIGDNVIVIGENKEAVQAARAAVRTGAAKVTVISPLMVENTDEAKAEGVKFKPMCILKDVKTDADGKVCAIVVEKLRVNGADGKAGKLSLSGKTEEIEASAVIIAGRRIIDNATVNRAQVLNTTSDSRLDADLKTFQTSDAMVFAGGDAVKAMSVVEACASGREAADSIHRYIHAGINLNLGRTNYDYNAFDIADVQIPADATKAEERQQVKVPEIEKAVATYNDLRETMTKEQVKKEASRCLGCGVAKVDEYMCLGCGICTTKCKFGAIQLEKFNDSDGGKSYKSTLIKILANGGKRFATMPVKAFMDKD